MLPQLFVLLLAELQLIDCVGCHGLALLAGLAGALPVLQQPVFLRRQEWSHFNQTFDRNAIYIDDKLADLKRLLTRKLARLTAPALLYRFKLKKQVVVSLDFLLSFLGDLDNVFGVAIGWVAKKLNSLRECVERLSNFGDFCDPPLFFLRQQVGQEIIVLSQALADFRGEV